MQKIIDLLEQHVQWVAIGLGGLFVLFMTYSYVLTPVASVEVAGRQVTPGEIDQVIVDQAVRPLESAMNSNAPLNIQVPVYVAEFKDRMDWKNDQTPSLVGGWQNLPPLPNSMFGPQVGPVEVVADPTNPNPVQPQPPGPGGVVVPVPQAKVQTLPVLPPATPAESQFGRSVIIPQQPGQGPGAAIQPVAAGGPAGPGVVQGVDKDWVTQLFKLDLSGIDAAFKAAGIPPTLADKTNFLQVELIRQEQVNGKWDPATEKVIPPLGLFRNNQPPPPFPDAKATRDVKTTYLSWALSNGADIVEPLFYATEPGKGDMWQKPGAAVVAVQAQLDLENPPVGWQNDPVLKKQVMEYRQEKARRKAEEDRAKRKGAAPSRPPPGAGRPGPGIDQPALAPRDVERYHAAPRYGPSEGPPEMRIPGTDYPGGPPPGAYPPPGYPGAGQPIAPGQPAALPQPGVDFPAAEFDPAKWVGKTMEIWAHDDTVQPGKIYRYKIRYKIKNPIFGAANVAVNNQLSEPLELVSPESEWGEPVKVPALVNFYMVNAVSPNGNTAKFKVFRFHNGQMRAFTFPVTPGDQIGKSQEGVDFSTGWTVVDFRYDNRVQEWQVVIVDDTGNLVTRSLKTDQTDKLFQQLEQQVLAANAAANPGPGQPGFAAGAGAPGMGK